MKDINFVSLIWEASRLLRKNLLFIVLVIILYTLIAIFQSIFGNYGFISVIINFLINSVLMVLLARFTLDLVNLEKINLHASFSDPMNLLKGIGVYLLYMIIIIGGLILLVIPGIYLAVRLQYAIYFMLENKNLAILDAIKMSWKVTDKNMSNVFAFSWLMFGFVMLGLIALLFGILFTAPAAMIATVLFYKKLSLGHSTASVQS